MQDKNINDPNFDSLMKIYLKLFKGREDYLSQQVEDRYRPVKAQLNEFYLRNHIGGEVTFGLYVLNKSSDCFLTCIDIDIPKSSLNSIDFKESRVKYSCLRNELESILTLLTDDFNISREAILLEDTGGRGYHIWIFFSGPVSGELAVKFGKVIKQRLDFEIEFFPKQGNLNKNRKYGNLIKLPLGIHRKYNSWSNFFTQTTSEPRLITTVEEINSLLGSVAPVEPHVISRIVETSQDKLSLLDDTTNSNQPNTQERSKYKGSSNQLLSNCIAMSNLRKKAERQEPFSQKEAFHFANVMISVSDGINYIHETIKLSFSEKYSKSLTQNEIERIKPLYVSRCRTLVMDGICPKYCKESVRKKNEDPLVNNTTPCSVWLRKLYIEPETNFEDQIERIGNIENLKRAFFQLKRYHEFEDTLFFDIFDYQQYERQLDSNLQILATSIINKKEIPFNGYLPVSIPKKINDDKQLEYRGMTYSTVYDQIYIQAIFNIIAPIVESEFQRNSLGYRWNTKPSSPYRVFQDWRVAYPKFRNHIMAALKSNPNGFYMCCDIKRYYDNIDHEILIEQIRSFPIDPYVFQTIESILGEYTYNDNDEVGLPQGPTYARLLANLYLNDFDIFVERNSVAYFRYVDDFVIVFESEEKAEEGLRKIIQRLRDIKLELSEDESKRATIEQNIDVSKVVKVLDINPADINACI